MIGNMAAVDDGAAVSGREQFIAVIIQIESEASAPGVFASVSEGVEEELDGIVVIPERRIFPGVVQNEAVVGDLETQEEILLIPGDPADRAQIVGTAPFQAVLRGVEFQMDMLNGDRGDLRPVDDLSRFPDRKNIHPEHGFPVFSIKLHPDRNGKIGEAVKRQLLFQLHPETFRLQRTEGDAHHLSPVDGKFRLQTPGQRIQRRNLRLGR